MQYIVAKRGKIRHETSDKPHWFCGMLMYTQNEECVLPNHEYRINGNTLTVWAVYLNCDLADILADVNVIVQFHLGDLN